MRLGSADERWFQDKILEWLESCLKICPFGGRKFIDTVLLEGKHENAELRKDECDTLIRKTLVNLSLK